MAAKVEPRKREVGRLVVVVLKARNLADKHSFSKQDPYVVVQLWNSDKKEQTPVQIKGGQHPVWDEQLETMVVCESKEGEKQSLKIQVWRKEPVEDELIGEGVVVIKDESWEENEFDDWVPVNLDGKYKGDVFLEMTFYEPIRPTPKPAPAPPAKDLAPSRLLPTSQRPHPPGQLPAGAFRPMQKQQYPPAARIDSRASDGTLMRRPSKLDPSTRLAPGEATIGGRPVPGRFGAGRGGMRPHSAVIVPGPPPERLAPGAYQNTDASTQGRLPFPGEAPAVEDRRRTSSSFGDSGVPPVLQPGARPASMVVPPPRTSSSAPIAQGLSPAPYGQVRYQQSPLDQAPLPSRPSPSFQQSSSQSDVVPPPGRQSWEHQRPFPPAEAVSSAPAPQWSQAPSPAPAPSTSWDRSAQHSSSWESQHSQHVPQQQLPIHLPAQHPQGSDQSWLRPMQERYPSSYAPAPSPHYQAPSPSAQILGRPPDPNHHRHFAGDEFSSSPSTVSSQTPSFSHSKANSSAFDPPGGYPSTPKTEPQYFHVPPPPPQQSPPPTQSFATALPQHSAPPPPHSSVPPSPPPFTSPHSPPPLSQYRSPSPSSHYRSENRLPPLAPGEYEPYPARMRRLAEERAAVEAGASRHDPISDKRAPATLADGPVDAARAPPPAAAPIPERPPLPSGYMPSRSTEARATSSTQATPSVSSSSQGKTGDINIGQQRYFDLIQQTRRDAEFAARLAAEEEQQTARDRLSQDELNEKMARMLRDEEADEEKRREEQRQSQADEDLRLAKALAEQDERQTS